MVRRPTLTSLLVNGSGRVHEDPSPFDQEREQFLRPVPAAWLAKVLVLTILRMRIRVFVLIVLASLSLMLGCMRGDVIEIGSTALLSRVSQPVKLVAGGKYICYGENTKSTVKISCIDSKSHREIPDIVNDKDIVNVIIYDEYLFWFQDIFSDKMYIFKTNILTKETSRIAELEHGLATCLRDVVGTSGLASVDDKDIVFLAGDLEHGCAIMSIPQSGGMAVTLAERHRDLRGPILSDQQNVYWKSFSDGFLHALSKSSRIERVVSKVSCGDALFDGDSDVYCMYGDSAIIKISKSTGKVDNVALNLHLEGPMAVSEGSIFFVARNLVDQYIMKISRTGVVLARLYFENLEWNVRTSYLSSMVADERYLYLLVRAGQRSYLLRTEHVRK